MALLNSSTARPQRQPSRKLWIREILDGELRVTEGAEPNTLTTARGDALRVSIIGVVIGSEDLPVSTLTVDDGTGQVMIRSFDRKLPYNIGTVVHVIGRPRSYQGVFYIAAEGIAAVNPSWGAYRKRELGEVQQSVQPKQVTHTQEPAQGEGRVDIIMRCINELDDGNGAAIEQVALRSKVQQAEEIIEQLLLAGDIFELRPGRVKIL